MSQTTAAFAESLGRVGATLHRTDAAGVRAALREAVAPPAVGSRVPIADVSLDDAGIETDPTVRQLREARTGVTPAAFAVAEYGSLAIRSRPDGDEPVSLYPERHVAVVAASDVLPDMDAAFERLAASFGRGEDSVVFATGPSATGDMGALVEGVHGPREVHVVVVEDR